MSSNDARANALDVLGKSYSYLFAGAQLDSCQLLSEEIQDYRNECYARRKERIANGNNENKARQQKDQQEQRLAGSIWSRIATRITQPSGSSKRQGIS